MLCPFYFRKAKKQSMRRTVPLILASVVFVPLVLAGCETIVNQRGFAATPGSLEKIEIGTQSREDVVRLIGSPSAVGTFNPNVWYYISQKQEGYAFFKPKIDEQKVIQLSFNEAGRLQAIKNYELKDGKDVAMVSRITPTAGKELTILEQILGNVGRFSGPRQEANPGAPTGGI
jgi:outer membrane protein assembly factor BamE (lipoprotein component of BamABCDE complex)